MLPTIKETLPPPIPTPNNGTNNNGTSNKQRRKQRRHRRRVDIDSHRTFSGQCIKILILLFATCGIVCSILSLKSCEFFSIELVPYYYYDDSSTSTTETGTIDISNIMEYGVDLQGQVLLSSPFENASFATIGLYHYRIIEQTKHHTYETSTTTTSTSSASTTTDTTDTFNRKKQRRKLQLDTNNDNESEVELEVDVEEKPISPLAALIPIKEPITTTGGNGDTTNMEDEQETNQLFTLGGEPIPHNSQSKTTCPNYEYGRHQFTTTTKETTVTDTAVDGSTGFHIAQICGLLAPIIGSFAWIATIWEVCFGFTTTSSNSGTTNNTGTTSTSFVAESAAKSVMNTQRKYGTLLICFLYMIAMILQCMTLLVYTGKSSFCGRHTQTTTTDSSSSSIEWKVVCELGPGLFLSIVASILFIIACIFEYKSPYADPIWSLTELWTKTKSNTTTRGSSSKAIKKDIHGNYIIRPQNHYHDDDNENDEERYTEGEEEEENHENHNNSIPPPPPPINDIEFDDLFHDENE